MPDTSPYIDRSDPRFSEIQQMAARAAAAERCGETLVYSIDAALEPFVGDIQRFIDQGYEPHSVVQTFSAVVARGRARAANRSSGGPVDSRARVLAARRPGESDDAYVSRQMRQVDQILADDGRPARAGGDPFLEAGRIYLGAPPNAELDAEDRFFLRCEQAANRFDPSRILAEHREPMTQEQADAAADRALSSPGRLVRG